MDAKGTSPAFLDYLRRLADAMDLQDWTVMVRQKPTRKGFAASVNWTYGRRIIELSLCKDFFDESLERQRHYLTHELVHIHFMHLSQAAYELCQEFPTKWMRQFELRYKWGEEHGVDAVAAIIARNMPLPPKLDASGKETVPDELPRPDVDRVCGPGPGPGGTGGGVEPEAEQREGEPPAAPADQAAPQAGREGPSKMRFPSVGWNQRFQQ